MGTTVNFEKYNRVLSDSFFKVKGKVVNVVGLTIESKGPQARLGDICVITSGIRDESGKQVLWKGSAPEAVWKIQVLRLR